MTDDQLLRYSRHILLNEIGIEGQERITQGHALVVGMGGLGSPVALYLGSAGVGQLTLVDHDTVDLTNLQRQVVHTMAQVGRSKVLSAQSAIHAINPDVTVTPVITRADSAVLNQLVSQADVVLDCSDNFSTRHAINAACVAHGKPLVSGAAIRFDGLRRRGDPPALHHPARQLRRVRPLRQRVLGQLHPAAGQPFDRQGEPVGGRSMVRECDLRNRRLAGRERKRLLARAKRQPDPCGRRGAQLEPQRVGADH